MMLLVAALIGAAAGWVFTLALGGSSDFDVAAEANRLVPPGASIDDESAGRPGPRLGPLFDYRGPYSHRVEGRSAVDGFDDRVVEIEALVRQEGWTGLSFEVRPNAMVLEATKADLSLSASVRGATNSFVLTITVVDRSNWWLLVAVLVGAVLAVGVVYGVSVFAGRSRGQPGAY